MSTLQWLGVLYASCGIGTFSGWLLVSLLSARYSSPRTTWRHVLRALMSWRFLGLAMFALVLWPSFLALLVADEKRMF